MMCGSGTGKIHVMAHIYAAQSLLCLAMIERGERVTSCIRCLPQGLLTQPYTAAYATTKHAAIGFAESLAITHGDDGVKVSCLCPQAVDTAMLGRYGWWCGRARWRPESR